MSNEIDTILAQLRQAVDNATAQLNYAEQLLGKLSSSEVAPSIQFQAEQLAVPSFQGNQQIVEGVFNGQNMVGADGKIYTIPANYASKSKLVEGDILKLTIRPDGSFIYKQIGPVERNRLVGTLVKDDNTGEYSAMIGPRAYKLITAAVTYYRGRPGDEVVILTPEDGESTFAAVENLIHEGEGSAASFGQTETDADLLADGTASELPSGDEAELPSGESAELASGAEAELGAGEQAE